MRREIEIANSEDTGENNEEMVEDHERQCSSRAII